MSYSVVITAKARDDLLSYYQNAAKHAPLTAQKWLDRFRIAINQLATEAARFPFAAEAKALKRPVRQMLFGKRRNVFRVLFTIHDDEVTVLHIRRSTMGRAKREDIE